MKVTDVLYQLIMERRMEQREPRLHDPGFLAFLRKKPCAICGKSPPSDACHIRFASKAYGKREVGLGEKPHDRWAIPMCREHHALQHSMNEQLFYRQWRILPLLLAQKLYAEYGGTGGSVRHKKKPRVKLPIEMRQKIPSRPFPQEKRKLKSRGFK